MNKKSKGLELLRFIVCGGTAAVIDYLVSQVVVLLLNLTGLKDSLVTIFATATGFTVSVIFNYLISTFWVYKNVDKDVRTKSAKFIILFVSFSLFAMALSVATMWLCNLIIENSFSFSIVDVSIFDILKANGIKFLINGVFWAYAISFVIKSLVGLVFNYFTRKYVLYKEPKVSMDIAEVRSRPISIKKLSIVVPCYNEQEDIEKKMEFTKQFVSELDFDFEIICVNDGSKDNTKEVISKIEGIKAISYESNRGKGGAVKEGILNATGDYVLFMDADLSTDLDALKTLLPLCGEYDYVIGSRHAKGSMIPIKQPLKRRFIGRCCRLIVNVLIGTHYKDTQCGFKAIRTDLAKEMVQKQIINGFAFDVEYLYYAKLNNLSVVEIPITWRDDRGSTVNPIKSSIAFFKDIFKIKKNKKNYIKN